jgi:hypothetical protein
MMLIVIKVFGEILTCRQTAIIALNREEMVLLKFRNLGYGLVFYVFARSVGDSGSPLPESSLADLELECREPITTAVIDIRCFRGEPINAFDALGDVGRTVHFLDPPCEHHRTGSEQQDRNCECDDFEELHWGF